MKEELIKIVPIEEEKDEDSPEVNSENIKSLNETLESVEKKLTRREQFISGMLRGAGVIIGATLLVIVAGFFLRLAGVLPGLAGIAEIILEAFDRARLGGS